MSIEAVRETMDRSLLDNEIAGVPLKHGRRSELQAAWAIKRKLWEFVKAGQPVLVFYGRMSMAGAKVSRRKMNGRGLDGHSWRTSVGELADGAVMVFRTKDVRSIEFAGGWWVIRIEAR